MSLPECAPTEAVCVPFLRSLGFTVSDSSNQGRSHCNGLNGAYSMALHIGGIFIILFASLLGVLMPMMSKHVPFLRSNPFFFVVGKTAATGVLLSVSCIHLINEAGLAFQEPCIYDAFKNYNAYQFLFALMAALLMQALDLQLAEIAEDWMLARHEDDNEVTIEDGDTVSVSVPPEVQRRSEAMKESLDEEQHLVEAACQPAGEDQDSNEENAHSHQHNHSEEQHGHQHLVVVPPDDMGQLRRVISAVCMEFGVTLHSLFVGLAVGLTTDSELKPLLVALVFHQMFEGMAMGSRLVDASFHSTLELILALVFSFSAPFGMVVATIAVSASRDAMAGGWFVTMMAILDAFCGGILLYLAFNLLFVDFTADLKKFSARGSEGRVKRKIILYVALWFGMLLMALVGKWL